MSKILSIYKNELKLYCYSWLGWASLIIINIIGGMGYLLGSVRFGNFQHFFSLVEMPFAWAIFIAGSRSFAKDKELGLFTLFFTAPLNLRDVVLAKYFALVTFFSLGAISLLFYPILSFLFFSISWMTVLSGLVSLLLVILLFSAISLLASSCTDNTLVSIVISFGVWMLLYLLGSFSGMIDPNLPITILLKETSYSYHFNNISSGVFSLSDLCYFIVLPVFILKMTESKILAQIAH